LIDFISTEICMLQHIISYSIAWDRLWSHRHLYICLWPLLCPQF